jgi:putative transcriptional regulator
MVIAMEEEKNIVTRDGVEDDGGVPSRSDIERLRNQSNEDVERAAENDPDCPPLTDEELEKFKPISEERRKRYTGK